MHFLITITTWIVVASAAGAANNTTEPSAPTLPARVAVESLADHPINRLRIEGRIEKSAYVVGNCGPKAVLTAKPVAFDPGEFIRVSFIGLHGKAKSAAFTELFCDQAADVICVFIGNDDQILVRASVQGDFQRLDRWHVPDDRVGYIGPQARSKPELIGIARRDAYFDTAEALVRYPIYDELRLCRGGEFLGGGGESQVCTNRTVRQLPAAELYWVESVADDSITLAGPRGPFKIGLAPDDAPVRGRRANPPVPTTQPDLVAEQNQRRDAAIAGLAGLVGPAMQSVGTSNWGAGPVTELGILAGGRTFPWSGTIRAGGGESSESPVREVQVEGKVKVTYTDGNGHHRQATFIDVSPERRTTYPNRVFCFDAGYNVLLHSYDLTDEGTKDEKWFVPQAEGAADKQIARPELLGTSDVPSLTGVWQALIRYPRNDSIDIYYKGDMLGGSKTDFEKHNTKDGDPRYRIELIEPDKMILVRDGKRITIAIIYPHSKPTAEK